MGALTWRAVSLMVPSTGFYALEGCGVLIPLLAASRAGTGDEAAASELVGALGLGSTVLTCVALVVRSGWAGGQDALVSQAYGKGDFARARTHLHQCQLWMTLLACTAAALLCFTAEFLLALGAADERTAGLAAKFVFASLPGLWFDFQYEALRKFLLNQALPTPNLVVSCLTVPAQFVWCQLLLRHAGLEPMHSLGAAWVIKSVSSFALLAAYTSWRQPRPSCERWWWPFHAAALSRRGLREYARIGLPSTLMYGLDWWGWEVLTLLAGGLHDGPMLAAHVAAGGASDWLFTVMRGASKVGTILVGEAAGRGDAAGVRAAARVCAGASAGLCSAMVLAVLCGRRGFVAWLLPDEGLAQDALLGLVPLMALQLALDAGNSVCQCILSGLAQQGVTSAGAFLTEWVVQLPLCWWLMYSMGWGVVGLRVGASLASVLSVAYNAAVLYCCLRSPPKADTLPAGEYAAMRQPRPQEYE